jgi:hypothetical protein
MKGEHIEDFREKQNFIMKIEVRNGVKNMPKKGDL